MKKLVVFILLLCCLAATFAFKNEMNPIFALDAQKVCIVADKTCNFQTETVQCGDLIFNFCPASVARENISKLGDFEAIQVYFLDISVDEILKTMHANVISKESVGEIEIVNAYTPYFGKSVQMSGKKVNLQIAAKSGEVIVGFPMILTGY